MTPRISRALPGPVDVGAVELHGSRKLCTRHDLVHPVQDSQERRLPAARRADQRRHPGAAHRQVDGVEHQTAGEPGAHPGGLELCGAALVRTTAVSRRRSSKSYQSLSSLISLGPLSSANFRPARPKAWGRWSPEYLVWISCLACLACVRRSEPQRRESTPAPTARMRPGRRGR